MHEDRLAPQYLSKYRALILPNTALLSDAQCAQLRAYVQAGGSLLATFETSLYTERNERRAEFGLSDVFGIHKAGERVGTNGNPYYARIEQKHPILEGFADTNWLPGAENRIPLAAVEHPVLTVVPGFPSYPPELAYPPVSQTTEPAVVLREQGRSRLAYFPGDIEHTLWRSGNKDLSDLLVNTIRWVAHDETPYTIRGVGVIDSFAWETEAGYALHLLNYTNPNAYHGWLQRTYPLGEQRVRMQLPEGVRVKRVTLLRKGTDAAFRQVAGAVEFTVPGIEDYEVVALSV